MCSQHIQERDVSSIYISCLGLFYFERDNFIQLISFPVSPFQRSIKKTKTPLQRIEFIELYTEACHKKSWNVQSNVDDGGPQKNVDDGLYIAYI